MEAADSSETLITFCKTVQRHRHEDSTALPRPRRTRTRTIDEQPCADQGDGERERVLKRKSAENSFSRSSAFVDTINGRLSV
jgi:hypothetical protein